MVWTNPVMPAAVVEVRLVSVLALFSPSVFSSTTMVTMSPTLRALRSMKSRLLDVGPAKIEPGDGVGLASGAGGGSTTGSRFIAAS